MAREIFFFKNYAENQASRLGLDYFFFGKALYEVKASGKSKVVFNYIE